MRNLLNPRWRVAVLVAACLALVATMTARPRASASGVVISQVYGGGGNSGATLKNDFIELFNAGSATVSLDGWSVQYASASGNSWTNRTNLSGTIEPGHYYLIQEAAGSGGTLNLPTPDVTGSIGLSGSAGKVALVASTTVLTAPAGGCPSDPKIVDLVSYGGNCAEGGAAAPGTPNNFTAVIRNGGGATDTDNNAADFTLGAPNPHNSGRTTSNPSGIGTSTPAGGGPGTPVLLTVTVQPGVAPASTGLAVTADLSQIGGSSAQTFFDNGTSGDAKAGDNTFSYQITVGSSIDAGSKSLAVSISDAQLRSGNATITFVVEPSSLTPIHDIQGTGTASGIAGELVMTQGIVTGVKTNGFFIQAAAGEADADPNTSEGVWVYTAIAPPITAAPGNLVKVVGTVQEYSSLTEIGSPAVVLVSTGNDLPEPVAVTSADVHPSGGLDQLERYEGMRVSVDSLTVVAPTDGSGVFYGVFAGVARPFREPGLEPSAPIIPDMPSDVPVFDGNPERLGVATQAIGAHRVEVTTRATVTGLVGPLDYSSGTYTIDVDTMPGFTGNISATPVPAAPLGQFAVASWNMLNFTTNTIKMAKASLVIRDVMRMPDIIGVEEVNSLATLQALAARVNADAGASSPGYTAYLNATTGSQNVGFLVRSSVTVNEVIEEGKDATFPDPKDGSMDPVNDRPPLVLRATIKDPRGTVSFPITVVVNHMRSMIDVEADTDAGLYARAKRKACAEFLAALIDGYQAAGEHVVSVGDYNAFQFNDGYVDVVGTVAGAPAPPEQVLLWSPDLVNPDFTDLMAADPSQRYSYVENGSAQIIDHILVSPDMLPRVTGLAYARNNADFPAGYASDSSRPERASDHDPVVAYFSSDATPPKIRTVTPSSATIWAPNHSMTPITIMVSAADEADPAPGCRITGVSGNDGMTADDWQITGPLTVSLRAERLGPGNGRTYTIGVSCTDASGNVSAPASTTVLVPHDQRK